MNKLVISTNEVIIINMLLHYKFLTVTQLSKLLKIDLDTVFLQTLEEKHFIKSLKLKNSTIELENIYFAIPNTQLDIDNKRYFQDIDLRQLSITKQDYFHIYYTVNYHILFDTYTKSRNIEINYFSSYFDTFKNKTKKNELEVSGRYQLNSGDYIIPNATMNFTLPSGDEYIYALDLFCDHQIEGIVERVTKYNQVLIENVYKLDRIVFIFEDNITKDQGVEHILDSNILRNHKNNFIFKTVKNMEEDFSLHWMLFYSNDKINFLSQLAQVKKELDIEALADSKSPALESKTSPDEAEAEIVEEEFVEAEVEEVEQKKQQLKEEKEPILKQKSSSFFDQAFRDSAMIFVENTALFIYLLAGVAAFVVSAYMEMIAFDSFYPGFLLISVVMVIAFEVAKVGTIFMRVYIKNSKTELSKITLKILGSIFIPLLFGLSIISSMAVTADKLESPHAEELKKESIKKIQTEYDDIVSLTEKDHLRRTEQLKQDFFEKIAEFEGRKKEVIADKDAQIEKQKTVYGEDGKTWKGSKYEEHIKERTTLIDEFAKERMQLEHLYNDQIEQESEQYRKEKKEDLQYKTQNLSSAESEVLANSWQAQNEMVRSFIKVVNHGFHLGLKELDFIFMLSILVSILLELTIYKVFSNIAVAYTIQKKIVRKEF
ncbi:hypothetical protein SAMN06313540_1075 [Epsilonproteobacteria bacterium SCGC AD-308-E02]|nr:hypothetical protein SAMN06313540_1075 [Epsilonproteobacteria bacterium SCGC AD-308-E02]